MKLITDKKFNYRRKKEEEKNLGNMQEGVDKIIEDATSIDGDGFENMDLVNDT